MTAAAASGTPGALTEQRAREAVEAVRPDLADDLTLLRLALTAVFRAGDLAVKVASPEHRSVAEVAAEQRLCRHLLTQGVPIPAQHGVWVHDGMAVAVSDYLPSDLSLLDWGQVGELLARLHRLRPPADLPRFSWPDAVVHRRLRRLVDLGRLREGEAAGLRARLPQPADLTAGEVVLNHGDLHTGNMRVGDSGVALIDWEKARVGSRAVDLSSILGAHERHGLPDEAYAAFCDGYGDDPAQVAGTRELSALRAVSGTTYLLLSEGAPQRAEGKRRLDALLHGVPHVWRDT